MDDYRWLARLWPLAILFHLAGNSEFIAALVNGRPTTVALAQVGLAATAVLLLANPTPPVGMMLAALFLAVTWLKTPRIGNHEVLLALVGAVLLLSALFFDDRWLARAAPALRWLFVISYGAMALSKLNEGFLSSQVSCAVVFGDELGRWIGIEASSNPHLSRAAIVIAVVTELSIPVLLVGRRWRNLGVLVGLVFHTGLALDPVSHVFDFTSALTPMFLLFADDEVHRDLTAVFDRLAEPFSGRGLGLLAATTVTMNGIVLAAGWPRWLLAYPLWLLLMTSVIRLVAGRLGDQHRRSGDLRGRRLGPSMAIPLVPVVALAVVNAVAPYAQVRTAAGFNMYSNLETARTSNHLLFADVPPARDLDLVEVVDAPDGHPLAYYLDRGVAVPAENLRTFRAHRSSPADAEVELRWLDPSTSQRPARLSDLAAADGGWMDVLAHKLAYRRSVDLQTPARCLREWGPLG